MSDENDGSELNEQRNFKSVLSSSINPALRHLASHAPVFHKSPDGNYLDPVIPVGKTRFRLLDKENKPLGGKQLRVSVLKGDEVVEERLVTTGPTGYATSDFRVPTSDGTKVKVEPVFEGETSKEYSRTIDVANGKQEGAEIVHVSNSDALMLPGVQNIDHWGFPTLPDINDVFNAPELFNPNVIEQNGTCALDFTASVETRQFYFNQIIRKGTPDLTTEEERKEITKPVSFDLEAIRDSELTAMVREGPTQAASPELGKLNLYKQSWTRVGHGIGKLLYSLALAPCEETKIAMIEWSREERGRRRERTQVSEQLEHELHRDRMIEESVEGAVDEVQEGHSSSSQAGGGLTGGLAGSIGKVAAGSLGISLGGSAAQSESYSEGHRQVTLDTLHNLQDSVVQRSSSLRSRRSTVVTQSQQIENENIRTRIVRNRNRNHAMTVEYFQVLEHYNVQTELERQVDVLLVPYEVPAELWNIVPPFNTFIFTESDRLSMLATLASQISNQLASYLTADGIDEVGDARLADERQLAEDIVESAVLSAGREIIAEENDVHIVENDPMKLATEAWKELTKRISGDERPLLGNFNIKSKHFNRGSFVSAIIDAVADIFDRADPRSKSTLIAWIDRYAEDLQELLPTKHRDGIEALYRLVHTPEIYESENPTATVSRWTIEMRQGWRPGLAIIAHTGDGQEVSLQYETDRKGSAISTFSSPPIDIQAVEKFEVVYAPEKAKTNVIREVADEFGVVGETLETIWNAFSGPAKKAAQDQVEKMKKYELKRLRITGHTDPSKYLSGTKSYELLEKSNVEEILTSDNPSWDYRTTQPMNIDFDLTESRRYRDYTKVEELITHIKANRMSYLRALWLREDADRRALRLENYTHKYFPKNENGRDVPILQLIENQPVGVMGNSVAFPLQVQGQRLQEGDKEPVNLSLKETQTKRLISLPTRGVYAETLLSKCNATEVRDVNRMIDPEQRCQASAPDITGISPGSRQSDMDLHPSQMPNPVVNIQNPPNAPQPTGTGGALDLLASGNIFRDMSLGSETVSAAQALAEKAMEESGDAQESTLKELSKKLEQAKREADSSDNKQTLAETQKAVDVARQKANEDYRKSDPVKNRDLQQTLDDAYEKGALSEEAYQRGSERLANARKQTSSGQVQEVASQGNKWETVSWRIGRQYFDKGKHTANTGEDSDFRDLVSSVASYVQDFEEQKTGDKNIVLAIHGFASREKEDPNYDNVALSGRRAKWLAKHIAEVLVKKNIEGVDVIPVAGGVGGKTDPSNYWKDQRADVKHLYKEMTLGSIQRERESQPLSDEEIKQFVIEKLKEGDPVMIEAEQDISLGLVSDTVLKESKNLVEGGLSSQIPNFLSTKVGEGVYLFNEFVQGLSPFISPDKIETQQYRRIYQRYQGLKNSEL